MTWSSRPRAGSAGPARTSGSRTGGPRTRPGPLPEALEGSLRRLKVDQIDLYQYHTPDPNVPFEEAVGAIAQLKDEGKIRHVGLSNVPDEQLRKAEQIVPVVSIQNRYNVTDRKSETIVDLCEQDQLTFLPWAPIQDADDIDVIVSAARDYGVFPRQIVLAWLLARSPNILPIPGSGSADHVEENVAAASIKLDQGVVAAITDAY